MPVADASLASSQDAQLLLRLPGQHDIENGPVTAGDTGQEYRGIGVGIGIGF
jgi:hypothetical protein